MEEHELSDITQHAMERVRDVIRLKLQLVDTEDECACVMLSVAADLMRGAQGVLKLKPGMTPDIAWATVIEQMLGVCLEARKRAQAESRKKKSKGVDSTTPQE